MNDVRPPPPKPRYLPPEHLLVVYEKLAEQGHRGAATRAAMLRAQLAAHANADQPQPA